MKNILLSELYKSQKSIILKVAFILPAIIPVIFFIEKISTTKNPAFDSFENNLLFRYYSNYLSMFSFTIGVFIVIQIVAIYHIDKQSKNLFYSFTSYQNLFKVTFAKFVFVNIYFLASHYLTLIVSLVVCAISLVAGGGEIHIFNLESVLLISLIFIKIHIASLGVIAFLWLISLLIRNSIIITPSIFILILLLGIKYFPLENPSSFFGYFTSQRRENFKKDAMMSTFNSFEFTYTDFNSLVWVIISIIILKVMCTRFSTFILNVNK